MDKIQSNGFYKPKILVVDDERSILLGLRRHLTARGYEVRTASGGITALTELEATPPDLLLLDLMMPDKSGLEVTREVRLKMHLKIPIIILSARGEEQQKVEALDQGADDYLTKPFGLDELLARVRVALRHRQEFNLLDTSGHLQNSILGNEYLRIDLEKHQVLVDGKEVKLTPKQFDLLRYLAINTGKLLTHQLLLHNIWGADYGNETSYLHVFVGQLRQKIEQNPAKPRFILTEPGLGYRFQLPVSQPKVKSNSLKSDSSNLESEANTNSLDSLEKF
jgi:two-component system KDP operon response regulator KdpE